MKDNSATFWQRKLVAFLHDPPNKPLDISECKPHDEMSDVFLRGAGFAADIKKILPKDFDHTAAAADRFPWPDYRKFPESSKFFGDEKAPFRHPLSDSDFIFDKPLPADLAADEFQQVQKGIAEAVSQMPDNCRDWANFFLHWRRWPIETAQKDCRTWFLPADTRIPDHSVWIHDTVVSALTACLDENGKFSPVFLVFQLGPVQEFIAQAQTTRDLWSGSYLLSWLTAHAIKAITDEIGPDCIIFPALRGLPLFDLLHRDNLYAIPKFDNGEGGQDTLWARMKIHENEILTPNLPNRFFAVVPQARSAELARKAVHAVEQELQKIGEQCWMWFGEKGHPLDKNWRTRFDDQIKKFPQITWQIYPWPETSVPELVAEFEKIDEEAGKNLRKLHDLATKSIEQSDRDNRYFVDKEQKAILNNRGFAWSYFYAIVDRLHAARRNTRDFAQWQTDLAQAGTPKDTLSGKEEIIGNEDWWKQLAERPELKLVFRRPRQLGAINLIKRVWDRAYLKEKWGVERRSFDSVPAVAAGKWWNDIAEKRKNDAEFCHAIQPLFDELLKSAQACRLTDSDIDPELLYEHEWVDCKKGAEKAGDAEVAAAAEAGLKTLRALYKKNNGKALLTPPPAYYAVLALDGDEMGKWISGAKTPVFKQQLSNAAKKYFEGKNICLNDIKRPLSPAYHAQFSEALSNFSLYLVRLIVEEVYHGQLIYAGGDDVFAMVPAELALDCAEALRMAFRGDPDLKNLTSNGEQLFDVRGTKGGYVRLLKSKGEQPSWPLIVPGPNADVSVGIAIGHIHAPLQSMVHAAQAAEKRAKNNYGRKAFAVTLYKRSGETIEWGAKWASGALALYRQFVALSNEPLDGPVLSNRFGYVLAQRLAAYVSPVEKVVKDVEDFPLYNVVRAEFDFVLRQQSRKFGPHEQNAKEWENRKNKFFAIAVGNGASLSYLHRLINPPQDEKDGMKDTVAQSNKNAKVRRVIDDFAMLFKVANFIHRGDA